MEPLMLTSLYKAQCDPDVTRLHEFIENQQSTYHCTRESDHGSPRTTY